VISRGASPSKYVGRFDGRYLKAITLTLDEAEI
jgi:hypothetical protein